MARKHFMAILAGIVDAATSHPDSNDVDRRVVMGASRLRIYIQSTHIRFFKLHIRIRTQAGSLQ
jgi:hypothetical protein